jgi:hypothetical protein
MTSRDILEAGQPLIYHRPRGRIMKGAVRTRFRYDEKNIFRELSENLYPDHLSSIRELGIQNPFDVDATVSKIDINVEKDTIEFSDNGAGMSSEVIKRHFLTIGFSSKDRGSFTPKKKRKIIGNKGIGRLSWQKLGRKAEIITETENEAHLIRMDRHSMEALVKKIERRGKTGTVWKIKGIIENINVETIKIYIQEKAGLLLRLNPDFHIMVNGTRVKPRILEGDIIRLMSERFDSSLILTNEIRRVAISTRGIVLDEIDLFGLGGYIDSDLFRETSDREKVLKDSSYKSILEEVMEDLLDLLLRMKDNKNLFLKYRENIIKVASRIDYKTSMKRKRLALSIPVHVLGRGWVPMESISRNDDKEILVEVSPDGSGSKRSERAADLGYTVILARSTLERTLIQATAKARRLEEIPLEVLSSRGVTVVDESYEPFLENALEILSVISDITINLKEESTRKGVVASISGMELPEEFIPAWKENFKLERVKDRIYQVDLQGDDTGLEINGIGIMLCQMENEEIIALADPAQKRIFLNTSSTMIEIMKDRPMEDQRVLLLDEICHEMAHILGYGLRVHDDRFFRVQKHLKYQAIRSIYSGKN